MAPEQEISYRIVREFQFARYPAPGKAELMVAVTVQIEDIPPHTFFIPKEEYTPEKLDELVIQYYRGITAPPPAPRRVKLPPEE